MTKITEALCNWIQSKGETPTEEDLASVTHALQSLYYAKGGTGEIPPQAANSVAEMINGIAYVDEGGIEPTGTIDITQNGEVNVAEYATANVAVPGQSAIKLLATEDIGTVSVTETATATSLGKTVSVSKVNAYDMLIVVATAATNANSKNLETVTVLFLTGTNNMYSKSQTSVATVKWNEYKTSVVQTSTITNAAGVFPMSPTVSSGTVSLPMYARADSSAGTINDTYTVRVFGVILETISGNGIVSQITQ